jgi:hypothetical protein
MEQKSDGSAVCGGSPPSEPPDDPQNRDPQNSEPHQQPQKGSGARQGRTVLCILSKLEVTKKAAVLLFFAATMLCLVSGEGWVNVGVKPLGDHCWGRGGDAGGAFLWL